MDTSINYPQWRGIKSRSQKIIPKTFQVSTRTTISRKKIITMIQRYLGSTACWFKKEFPVKLEVLSTDTEKNSKAQRRGSKHSKDLEKWRDYKWLNNEIAYSKCRRESRQLPWVRRLYWGRVSIFQLWNCYLLFYILSCVVLFLSLLFRGVTRFFINILMPLLICFIA